MVTILTIIFHVNNIMIMMMIINSITLICKMCHIYIYIYLYIYIYTLFHGKNAWMIFIHKLLYIKKQTSEYSEQMSFLMHCNQWLKIIQALSMVWCFLISYILWFFHAERYISKIGSRLLPSTVKHYRSYFWLEERYNFHSCSFSMYEINILLFTALELNFITVETNKQKVTD